VFHREIEIPSDDFDIRANIKVPDDPDTYRGIILSHGCIVNRKSLSRETYCLAEYLCTNLNAYVITPDYMGETVHKNDVNFENMSKVLNTSINYLTDNYNASEIMGFGHSMGCYVLVNTLKMNEQITSLVNYGGPTTDLLARRQYNFINYMMKYLTSFNYNIDTRNLFKYIFDVETSNYLLDVMLKDEVFGYENYNYIINPFLIRELVQQLETYHETITKWGKPTMFLFGTNDSLVKKSLKQMPDGYNEDNISVKHIQDASHVTPCMDTERNLSKLQPIISFYQETYQYDLNLMNVNALQNSHRID
jgi:pimeloyl-ACP methyl ester carboxylesterase